MQQKSFMPKNWDSIWGDSMYINKKSIEHFHAILNGFTYNSSEINASLSLSGLTQKISSQSITPQNRSLILTFEDGASISELTKELLLGATIDIDDGFLYDCLLISTPSAKHLGAHYYEVTYQLSTIQKGYLTKIHLNKLQNRIRVHGTAKAYPKFIINPKKDMSTFAIMDISLSNLKKNLVIVIDSVDKLVQENGLNKFSDTNLKKWPCLEIGEQIISISSLDADIYLEYYPMYV